MYIYVVISNIYTHTYLWRYRCIFTGGSSVWSLSSDFIELTWGKGFFFGWLVEVVKFQLSYFKLKKMLLLHSTCQQIWKTQQWPQDWKRSVFIPIPKKRNAKECSNYHTIVLISQTSKIMLKIHQARLQQYMNWELPDVQPGFRKGRGTRYQTANIRWIIEKAREFQKNIYFCFTDYAKPLTVWITTNCGKFWKRWE